ncbi:MAG: hypothetical protein E7277_07940 [Lachnospiraceae bacterium]|jgi:hypothetical protein|nr:hypothetical protein [Lachnospiraceae bacterium]
MKQYVIEVRYYNVSVFVTMEEEKDAFLVPYLKKMLKREHITLNLILEWCKNHGLKTNTKFSYRKDFPLKANVLNYLTYRHVLSDMRKKEME